MKVYFVIIFLFCSLFFSQINTASGDDDQASKKRKVETAILKAATTNTIKGNTAPQHPPPLYPVPKLLNPLTGTIAQRRKAWFQDPKVMQQEQEELQKAYQVKTSPNQLSLPDGDVFIWTIPRGNKNDTP